MNSAKIVVAHPGQQHSFRLASALKKQGLLHRYVTTVYRKQRSAHMWLIEALLSRDNQRRSRGRRNIDLEDSDVVQVCELRGLVTLLLYRLLWPSPITTKWELHTSRRFQSRVARLAEHEDVDAVVMYGEHGAICFRQLKAEAPNILRILDMPAASLYYMASVYEEDMARAPEFAARLKSEAGSLYGGCAKKLRSSFDDVDLFLSPSSFVKRSLEYSGVPSEKIRIVPYGSNFETQPRTWSPPSGPLRLIFVGRVSPMKGVQYLLEAVSSFPESAVTCALVGAFDNRDGIFDAYLERFDFIGHVSRDRVIQTCLESDVFVFPSLGEGMSLACLEAMSCGLPLICSQNSGVDDLIQNGYDGFVIPVGSIDALRAKIEWFIHHRESIAEMGRNAQRTASRYSWAFYEQNVVRAIEDALCEDGNRRGSSGETR